MKRFEIECFVNLLVSLSCPFPAHTIAIDYILTVIPYEVNVCERDLSRTQYVPVTPSSRHDKVSLNFFLSKSRFQITNEPAVPTPKSVKVTDAR